LSDGRFGFRMVDPTSGDRKPVFDFDDVREVERLQERSERLRLYYVAMTRAIDRLIVSGAIDLARTGDRETPIGWVLERLGAHEVVTASGTEPKELERGEARFVLRVNRFAEPEHGAPPVEAPAGQLALFDELPLAAQPVGIELAPFPPLSTPPTHDLRRLSYSALALFERCSYRYFAERIMGLSPRSNAVAELTEPVERGLVGTEIGDAIHRLLEHLPLESPQAPSPLELEALVRTWYPAVGAADLDRIAELVEAYCTSALAQRVAGLSGARVERAFTFEHDGVLLHGRLDVLWRSGARAVVVDYKSNALDGTAPREIVEAEYRIQRLVYALACLRDGATEVEVVYQFLERPEDIVSTTFTTTDLPVLERELTIAIERIRASDFRPRPSELACADCPALDLVCAGPRLPFAG
jgi:ATP-dependent helicase/nuclease subunit A